MSLHPRPLPAAALGAGAVLATATAVSLLGAGLAPAPLATAVLGSGILVSAVVLLCLRGLLRRGQREVERGEMSRHFVSLVSHEFRTPLGVIMSATEVLLRYFEKLPTEKRARHLEMIKSSTLSLAAMIEEVLLLSRVEAGRWPFTPAPLALPALVQRVAEETAGTDRVRLHLPDALPGAIGDEGLVRHILAQLLSNAVKYSGPDSSIDMTVERSGPDAIFTVADQGIGIPVEDQARVFQTFTRGQNVGEQPGTGLGLVIVRHCVELHGGRLRLRSTPGCGTTVTVTLPLFVSASPPATTAQLAPK